MSVVRAGAAMALAVASTGEHRDRANLANKGRHAKQVIRHRYEQERLRCVRSV